MEQITRKRRPPMSQGFSCKLTMLGLIGCGFVQIAAFGPSGQGVRPCSVWSPSTNPVTTPWSYPSSSSSSSCSPIIPRGPLSFSSQGSPSSSSSRDGWDGGKGQERRRGGSVPALGSTSSGAAIGWGTQEEGGYMGYVDDEAALVEEIIDHLGGRGLPISRTMQIIRKTKPKDLAQRWPGWRRNCDTLLSLGFSPENVTTILHGSSTFLHELDSETDIRKMCFYLWEDLGFESWGKIGLGVKSWQKHKYKVVTQAPEILCRRAETGVQETVATLGQIGMPTKYVLDASFRFPSLLCVPPSVIFFVSAYLSSMEVGFKPRDLGTLYRRNPWLLHGRTVDNLKPIVDFLKNGLSVQRIHVVLRGYPKIVMRTVEEDLQPRVALLQSLGIPLNQIGFMVESFPSLISLPIEEQMLPVLYYLQTELGFSRYDLWMMLRSFPAILGLSIEDNIKPVVRFLRDEIGVKDLRRFIQRLPPVLGYPVDWELRKKWACFQDLGLQVRDLEGFPGFFSYPLHDRILPRMAFMDKHQKEIDGVVLLRVGLTGSDAFFAKELMQVDPAEYEEFLATFKAEGKRVRAQRNKARRKGGRSSSSSSSFADEEGACD